jgi:prophage regulatory protein
MATSPTETRLLRRDEMLRITGLRDTQARVLEAQKRLPRRVQLGDRTVAWRSDEIDAWVAERSAARGNN